LPLFLAAFLVSNSDVAPGQTIGEIANFGNVRLSYGSQFDADSRRCRNLRG
jgi:hypothetical protein